MVSRIYEANGKQRAVSASVSLSKREAGTSKGVGGGGGGGGNVITPRYWGEWRDLEIILGSSSLVRTEFFLPRVLYPG